MTNVTSTEERVITLKEIVDTINAERVANGERKLEHGKQMLKVEELAKEGSFGVLDILAITSTDKGGRPFNTYNLTKKQAIAVGAKLDNKRLILIVDKLEELSQPKQLSQTEIMMHMLQTQLDNERALEAHKADLLEYKTEVKEDIVPTIVQEELDERFDKRPSKGFLSRTDLQARYGVSTNVLKRMILPIEDSITTEDCYKTVDRVGIVHYPAYLTKDVDSRVKAIMKAATKVTRLFWESELIQGRFKITNKRFIPKGKGL